MAASAGAAANDPTIQFISSRLERAYCQGSDRVMITAQALDRYRSALAEIGEDIEIRRYGGIGAARVPVKRAVVRGRVLGMAAEDLVGEAVQRTRKVLLLNDPAAMLAPGCLALADLLPLTANDKLFFREAEVAILDVNDDTRRINGVLVALEIVVKG